MNFKNILFPAYQNGISGFALFLLRVVFAVLLAMHGFDKLMNFSEMSSAFPDPLGLGSQLSLSLAIFGELVCSIAVIFGFLTRLAILPMIFTMLVAFFAAHGGSFANGGELAFTYLVVFLFILYAGPGHCSVDTYIGKKLSEQ